MNTFAINFTDLIGNFWTMDWEPSTSKNKNLTEADVQAVVTFIKTGNWPKSATAAAKNCYDTLAVLISSTIVGASVYDYERASATYMKIAHLYDTNKLSSKGNMLFERCHALVEAGATEENLVGVFKLMRKIIKSENLFAVKFAEDENWLADVMTDMKCCICGRTIDDDRQGHNPYPVRPQSFPGEKENRCCTFCNQRIVIPSRIRYGRNDYHHRTMMKMDYEELLNFVA